MLQALVSSDSEGGKAMWTKPICVLIAIAAPICAQATPPVGVRIDAFVVEGNVPQAKIDGIRAGLATWLNKDSCVNAALAPDPRDASYALKATISGPPDHLPIVDLHLVEARTNTERWTANYDYSGVPPGTMASDVLTALHAKGGPCQS
jgi:hypothetical protein